MGWPLCERWKIGRLRLGFPALVPEQEGVEAWLSFLVQAESFWKMTVHIEHEAGKVSGLEMWIWSQGSESVEGGPWI